MVETKLPINVNQKTHSNKINAKVSQHIRNTYNLQTIKKIQENG